MTDPLASDRSPRDDDYLFSPRAAWFAYAMTLALMIFDFVDRQIIVSLFPFIKAEWGLSDKQLGALVSVVSVGLVAAVFGWLSPLRTLDRATAETAASPAAS